MDNQTRQVKRFSCAETAALLRQHLKKAFPDTKMSIRSKTYSGGASISVDWTDGPPEWMVERYGQQYEGATFDGMQDLKEYHRTNLVDDDGNVETVRYGADYIFVVISFLRKEIYEYRTSAGSVPGNQNRGMEECWKWMGA